MITESKKRLSREAAIEVIKAAADRWPTSFVPRSQIPKFTGGLIAVGTCANRDSDGTGIPGAFRIGRQVCYPRESVVEFLISRLEEA